MFYKDNVQHHKPHIHAEYQGRTAVFTIPDGEIIAGSIPLSKAKLVAAWIEIHKDDLLADWALAVEGSRVFKIKGLE
jgi:hypothetical protein